MTFQIGNTLWSQRSSRGRNPIFKTPEDLWDAVIEYFEWVDENPLYEMKPFAFQGIVTQEPVSKMRAMSKTALCIFLDIDIRTWENYKANHAFFTVTTRAESIIYNQKFEGAAADLLNPSIIARDLGLKDQIRNEHTGANGSPIQTQVITLEDVKAEFKKLDEQY